MHRKPRILGYRKNGAPIWEIMGGADPDEKEGTDDKGTDDDQGADDKGTDDKGMDDGKKDEDKQEISSLPKWAQDIIHNTRKEAGDNRTGKKAAEDKYQSTLDSIAKALGLKDDEKPDPEKLTSQLTESQQEARTLKVERALDKAARKHGADEDLLVAWLAHQGKLKVLDPTSDTFAADVDALVKTTVEANAKLKASGNGGSGKSGSDFSGEGGNGGKDKDAPPEDMDEYRKWRLKRIGR